MREKKRQFNTRQIIFSEDLFVAGSFSQPGADSPSPDPEASLRNALGLRRFSPQGRTDELEPNHPAQAGLVLHSRRLQSWQEMIQAQGWSEQVWPFPLCMRWQRTCITDLSWTAYWFKGFQVVWDKAHFYVGYICLLYLRTSSTSDCKYTTFYTSPTTLKWDEANSL